MARLSDSITYGNHSITGDAIVNGVLNAASLVGDGSSLTALNASNITTGTIADARLPGTITSNITGSAAFLTTARNIALGGDLSGSANFDGSTNVTITATVADDSHNHIIANVDGLQTALDGKLGTGAKAADSELLDGINSTQFLRSDTSDNMSGNLTVSGSISAGSNMSAVSYFLATGSTSSCGLAVPNVGTAAYNSPGTGRKRSYVFNYQNNGGTTPYGMGFESAINQTSPTPIAYPSTSGAGENVNAIFAYTGTFTTEWTMRQTLNTYDWEFRGNVTIPDGTVGSNATRDVFISTADPTSGDGVDGDIWYTYTP